MDTIEPIIVAQPFWAGLNAQFVPWLVAAASARRYGVSDLIFQERRKADHLYLLCKGQVALETFLPGRGMTTLQILSAGDALGWSWLFPPFQWQFSARSVDPTEIVAFDAVALRAHAEKNPAFGRELVCRMVQVLVRRLQATRLKLQEFHDTTRAKNLGECLRGASEENDVLARTTGT